MCDINGRYQIDHEHNEMWIADNRWEEREDGQVQYVPGMHPFDLNKGIVEQATFMGILIIRKTDHKTISAHLFKWALLNNVHYHSEGNTLLTDESLCEFQDTFTEFRCLVGEPVYANSQQQMQPNFEIQ